MKQLLLFPRLLRMDNWIKNLLILFPLFFGKKLFSGLEAFSVVVAVLIFCLLTSCVYILNDLVDAPKDRNHPHKQKRPIAAREISGTAAIVTLVLLFAVTIIVALFFITPTALLFLGGYFVLNIFYSLWLKHIVIIDFFAVALFFEIRLFYGGIIANVEISHWLALTVFFLATLIALGKRRDDLLIYQQTNTNTREVIKKYNMFFLDTMIAITSSLAVFIYVIYSVSDWVVLHFNKYFYVTNIFVIIGLSKYLHTVFVEKKSGNPIKILFKDVFLLTCLLGWLITSFLFIYYG